MSGQKAFVTNAGDEKQVKEAKRKEISLRERELRDVSVVMSTVEGRRFLWRVMHQLCQIRENPFNHSGSLQNVNIGQQAIGRLVENDVYDSSVKLARAMEDENRPSKIEEEEV